MSSGQSAIKPTIVYSGAAGTGGERPGEPIGLDHFGAWFVIVLTVMLLKGMLVPFMVAAPRIQVELPSEIVLDSAGADLADRVSCLHPKTDNRRVHPIIYTIFIGVCLL